MDGASFSPYPHYSWFGIWRTMVPHERPLPVHIRQVNHVLFYAARGRAHVHWICRGQERRFEVPEHAVHFAPADGEDHVRIAQVSHEHPYFMLLIPPLHLDEILAAEGCRPPDGLQSMLGRHDSVLRMCIERLAGMDHPGESADSSAISEASRRLVLRLAELNGVGKPDWSCDASVFDRRTMSNLVDSIDEHLRPGPSLDDMALSTGLSPSHFARKFRHSTGLSLHRFVNRRRVLAALESLKERSRPLAHVAIDLGFSSQSHFTRLFGELTGMTPARYRKQFARTLG